MKYKTVCFDIDGTLYPMQFLKSVLVKIAAKHPIVGMNYTSTRVELRKCQKDFDNNEYKDKPFWYREASMYQKVCAKNLTVEQAGKFLDDTYYAYLNELYKDLGYQAKVVDLFKKLKAEGVKIGVLSDWPLWNKLEQIGVAEYCDFACDPYSIGFLKPDAHAFEYLLYNLKADASETLYVGDSYEKDVLGATGAGIDAVLINSKDNGKYPAAKKVFENWDDFSFWMEEN